MEHDNNNTGGIEGIEGFDGQRDEDAQPLTWAQQEAQWRDATAAPIAATPPAPTPVAPVSITPEHTGGPDPVATFAVDGPASLEGAPTEEPGEVFELLQEGPKKSKLKSFNPRTMLSAGLAVAVLGVGGFVAVNQFESSDSAGNGAGSPEAAVSQFFGSLEDEDFLGAAEIMEPAERRTMVNPGIEMVGELQRIGILAEGMDLGDVPGIDLQFTNMTYTPQSIGGGDVAVRVQVDGTVSGTGDPGSLPFGSLITDNLPPEALAELTAEGETIADASVESIDDLGVVAVQRDGEWYVSLWYSVAEAIRAEEQVEGLPAFGQGPRPSGGESPEDAVWAMVRAGQELDLAAMIGALDPQETAVLYDYSNLFLPDAQSQIDGAAADVDIEVTRLDMRSEIDGDNGQVWIDGAAFEASAEGEKIRVDTAADCVVEVVSDGSCEVSQSDIEEMGAGLGLGSTLATGGSIRVHMIDGRWYLSPTSSFMQPMLEALRGLERAQLQGWIDDPESLLGEDGPFGAVGLLPLQILGGGVSQSFEEIGSVVGGGEFESEFEATSPVDDQFEDFPPVSTTVLECCDGEPEFEDELPIDGTTTTSSVPEFTFDAPLPGTEPTTVPPAPVPETTVLPPTTAPDTSTTTTTAAPATGVDGDAETVLIFRVLEAAPAGTSAWSVLAEPIDVTPDEAAQYPGALTEDQAASIEGWVTLTAVEPGDILRFEWFIDE